MKGIFENFPDLYHGVALFSCRASAKNIQRVIISIFYRINRGEALKLPILSSQGIQLFLEVGIAEGLAFNFIDDEEKDRWLSLLENASFKTLDFLCIARYYISEVEKRKPLKFDYYMLRFIFGSETIELIIYHEKGTRRLSIEDLIKMLSEKINEELIKMGEAPLKIETLRAF